MRRRAVLGLAVVAALVGIVAAARRDEGTAALAVAPTSAPAVATAPPASSPGTAGTTPVFTLPALPLPDRPPKDWYAPTPEVVLGRLQIPKLGVDQPLQRGITLTAVNRGPGWWPGTAMPGQLGNVVVAGHRTTFSKPFNRLDELVPGDKVLFVMPEATYTYEVRGLIVVTPEHIGIAAQSYAHTATLFACHPKGSAAQRIVAKLRLLAPDGTPVDEDRWLPPVDQGSDSTGTTLFMRNEEPAEPGDGAPMPQMPAESIPTVEVRP